MELATDSHPPTILIVDDNAINRLVLHDLLQADYQILLAGSGAEALALAHATPRPDLVLLDIMMPGMDGHEVLQRLKADEGTQDIPVIFVTAVIEENDQLKGLRIGAVDYITKPFNCDLVKTRVAIHLELKAARDRLTNENQWLDRQLARRLEENRLIQDLGIRALACLAECRHEETGNHILRSQTYVKLLADHLSGHPRFQAALAGHRLAMLIKASPLHDIGKVGIPDTILLKEDALTAEEWEVMKTHAALGASTIGKALRDAAAEANHIAASDTASAFQFLQVAQTIALTHHEKWDGSGYPAGLVGEEIPVEGRLMALADVYDALTRERVYKQAVSLEKAAAYLIGNRGIHFDPDVVDAFIDLRDQFEEIARRFADRYAT